MNRKKTLTRLLRSQHENENSKKYIDLSEDKSYFPLLGRLGMPARYDWASKFDSHTIADR